MKYLALLLALILPTSNLSAQNLSNNQKREQKEAKERAKQERRAALDQLDHATQITINVPAERVRALLISNAAGSGATVEEATDYKIVITKKVGGMRGFLTQALIGNAYSEEPRYVANFTIVEPEKGHTLVTVNAEVIVRMAFGKVNRINLNENRGNRIDINRGLENIKRNLEENFSSAASENVSLNANPQPANSPAIANGPSPSAPIDLNGVWNFNGSYFRLTQNGSSVRAAPLGPMSCNGQPVQYLFEGQLQDANLSGDFILCTNPALINDCGFAATSTATFSASINKDLISGSYVMQGMSMAGGAQGSGHCTIIRDHRLDTKQLFVLTRAEEMKPTK